MPQLCELLRERRRTAVPARRHARDLDAHLLLKLLQLLLLQQLLQLPLRLALRRL